MAQEFGKPDVSLAAKKLLAEKERKEAIESAYQAACNCLQSPLFEKYKVEYERLEGMLIEELGYLDIECQDPVVYGFKAKDIISKLRHVGTLLRGVNADAGRG